MGLPIIGDLIDGVKDILSEVIVDKDKKKAIELELKKLEDEANNRLHLETVAQIELNKVEAGNGSVFVAGWRPFVGWVCGVGLGAQVILFPLLDRIFNWKMTFDTELLVLTLSGMLGLGSMRTLEKIKGVSTNNYNDRPKEPTVVKQILDILPEKAPWQK